MAGSIISLIFVLIYFLPSIWAARHHHKDATWIFAVNLLLGWTLAGWIVAIVWANKEKPIEEEDKTLKKCPRCAEFIKKEATKCRFCGHEFANTSN